MPWRGGGQGRRRRMARERLQYRRYQPVDSEGAEEMKQGGHKSGHTPELTACEGAWDLPAINPMGRG